MGRWRPCSGEDRRWSFLAATSHEGWSDGAQALLAAGLAEGSAELKEIDVSRAGILIGSAMGGMDTFATAIKAMHTQVRPVPTGDIFSDAQTFEIHLSMASSKLITIKFETAFLAASRLGVHWGGVLFLIRWILPDCCMFE